MNWIFSARKTRRLIATVVLAAGASATAIHPFGQVKTPSQTPAQKTILSNADVHPEVRSIIERACANCHSQETVWPWYSYVAPMSWLIENDVQNARARMDLSKWGEYSPDNRQQLLASIAAVLSSKRMPPPRYTLLHPEARLSDAEVQVLYQWARTERRRVKAALNAPSAAQ